MTLKQKFSAAILALAAVAGGVAAYEFHDGITHGPSFVQVRAANACEQDLASGGTCNDFGHDALELARKNKVQGITFVETGIAAAVLSCAGLHIRKPASPKNGP